MSQSPEAPFVLECAKYCHFKNGELECGDAVAAKDPDCLKAIQKRTGAKKLERLYTKVAGLLDETGEQIGKIRAGNVCLDSELNLLPMSRS